MSKSWDGKIVANILFYCSNFSKKCFFFNKSKLLENNLMCYLLYHEFTINKEENEYSMYCNDLSFACLYVLSVKLISLLSSSPLGLLYVFIL